MNAGVLTLTMNPCVDETRWYDAFDEGVVRREFQSGGKGINVARVLHNLGEDCAAVAPLGGETGRQCEELARSEGVQLLKVDVDAPTRLIVTHALCATFEQRQDYVSGTPLSEGDLEKVRAATLSAMEGRRIFCACGSAPDEKSAALVREMLTEAKKRGMMTVLDANGLALTEGWKAEPDIVKPNEQELAQLMGREISEAEILYAVEELAQRGQTVLLTLGEKGAMCAGDGNLYCVPAVKVETVNPVGSGDTFLAAWLHARIRGMDGMEAARFACALAAENAAMFPAARVGKTRP